MKLNYHVAVKRLTKTTLACVLIREGKRYLCLSAALGAKADVDLEALRAAFALIATEALDMPMVPGLARMAARQIETVPEPAGKRGGGSGPAGNLLEANVALQAAYAAWPVAETFAEAAAAYRQVDEQALAVIAACCVPANRKSLRLVPRAGDDGDKEQKQDRD
jgi:hypothetical protein